MRLPGPLRLLLGYEGYPPAVVVAVALHAGLLWFLLDRDLAPRLTVDLERPAYIEAAVIQENPQEVQRQQQVAEQRAREQAARERAQAEEQRRQAERERAEQAARERQAEEQRRAEAERQAREREAAQRREREAAEQREREQQARRERERQEQLAREQAARERAAREAEAARQRAEAEAAAQASAIATYSAVIREAVEANWSRPPSARNGMSVLLRIQLVPTGEVVDVTILQSSGDAAFDRSAEQAVRRARRFPELREMNINLFDREFRSFNLLFRPRDLLRDL